MRSLITGAGGQLGAELARRLGPAAVALTRAQLSILDADGVAAAIARSSPQVVFNCAAFNGVDRAESEAEAALAVNAEGAELMARACARLGVRLVHYSTNYVFDGALERPYLESDLPRPLSAYARSKLDGERRVLAALPSALVVRSAGLFGSGGSAIKGGSFPARILARARAFEPLRVVADQRLNPTWVGHLAEASVGLSQGEVAGVVHLVAEGCCSWHQLALATLELAGLSVPVEAINTAELGAAAARPLNGCLGSSRVAALPPWRDGLAEWFRAAGGAPLGAGEEG